METGTIVKLQHAKMYGFIRPDNTDTDVFFHRSSLLNRTFKQLAAGYPVEFRRTTDQMAGKDAAVDVRVVER